MTEPPSNTARLPALVVGFAAIYLIWGSTYLGIKFAVETLPPFLMAGVRFVTAGLLLYGWLRFRGEPRPSARLGTSALIGGALLLVGGNGLVTWGQQTVPSGVAALIIGTTPIWMLLLGWVMGHGSRPTVRTSLGMAAGFAGVVLLINPAKLQGAESHLGWGFLAIALAPLFWCFGTLRSRRADAAASPLMTSALQMMAGGALMVVAGTCLGEWRVLAERTVSLKSALAFGYLTLIGSLVGFSTYTWLMRVASPAAVATYGYVNPLVAVFLGWLLGNETLDANTLSAALLIVGAVVLITVKRPRRPVAATEDAPLPPRPGPARVRPAKVVHGS
jgi:drug/metabolite transporter (DMT)-like permease